MLQLNILTDNMYRAELLKNLVLKGEKRAATHLLDGIYEENRCRGYAAALEKILLTEAAKQLNDSVAGFYLDTDCLKEQLFSDNPPSRESVLKQMFSAAADAARENRLRTYEKAAAYIRQNLCDNQLTAKAAAEYAGVSASVLVTLFLQNEGVTPTDFLGKLRVEKSLEMLTQGDCVQTVAERLGFACSESYIRVFKKHMGTTPGVWKRNKLFL